MAIEPVFGLCREFTVEFPQGISKGQHKVLLQHFGFGVFNIGVGHIPVQALVLVEEIVTGEFDLGSFILKELFTKVQIPQGILVVDII